MSSLQERLTSVLGEILPVEEESDGALTVRHDHTFASLRVVTIADGLDLVSLTLAQVERAFRAFSTDLDIRPIRHRTETRVRAAPLESRQ